MLAALVTLVFAGSLWLAFTLAARTVEESGERILAALRAQKPVPNAPAQSFAGLRVSPRVGQRLRLHQAAQGQPKLRAAA